MIFSQIEDLSIIFIW